MKKSLRLLVFTFVLSINSFSQENKAGTHFKLKLNETVKFNETLKEGGLQYSIGMGLITTGYVTARTASRVMQPTIRNFLNFSGVAVQFCGVFSGVAGLSLLSVGTISKDIKHVDSEQLAEKFNKFLRFAKVATKLGELPDDLDFAQLLLDFDCEGCSQAEKIGNLYHWLDQIDLRTHQFISHELINREILRLTPSVKMLEFFNSDMWTQYVEQQIPDILEEHDTKFNRQIVTEFSMYSFFSHFERARFDNRYKRNLK